MDATIYTSLGNINVELYDKQVEKTVKNFVNLATGRQKWLDPFNDEINENVPFYNGLLFHRVIDGFMIQTGCPIGDGTGGPGYEFDDEIVEDLNFDKPYVLAMANAGKKPDGHGTNGSQFFITVAKTPHLYGNHTVFGHVKDDESKKVVQKIAKSETDELDKPLDEIIIETVTFNFD
jgi:peptidyl-prolyl cis-trans isomerase A (cyclophilin A)